MRSIKNIGTYLVIAVGLVMCLSTYIYATCADGGTAPGAACTPNTTPCATVQGITFSGICVAGSTNTSNPALIRCGGTAPQCGAVTNEKPTGCTSDGQCGSGFMCVSSAGAQAGCGTGFSQCIRVCSDSTTTTTTTA